MSTQKILELMRPFWGDRQVIASYVGGEFIEGHGAPVEVRNAHDDVICSVSVSGPTFRLPEQRLAEVVDLLVEAALEVSHRLGWGQR